MSGDRIERRPVGTVDDWARSQMPEFQRVMTPHLDFALRADNDKHQYYASDITQNAFAGWLAARRGLVRAGTVNSRGAWPQVVLNASGREAKHGTAVYVLRTPPYLPGAPE